MSPPAPARAAVVTTPFRFDARALSSKATNAASETPLVFVADGAVTVTEKEKNGRRCTLFRIDDGRRHDVLQLEAAALEFAQWAGRGDEGGGGAFGFLKGGRNWFGLQTKDSLLVLRVDDEAVGRVTAGLQERTGLTLQRLVEPKD